MLLKIKEEEQKFQEILADDVQQLLQFNDSNILKKVVEDVHTVVKFEKSAAKFLEKQ